MKQSMKPNVIVVLGDQWRAQATGYAGNPCVQTPHIDRFADASVNFHQAVSSCPVCSPARASFITGQRPLTHGVFLNDVHLEHRVPSIADVFTDAGYDTAYVGKWHLNARGRSNYIPPQDRQGFDYWKVLECTHAYNRSRYFAGDDPTPRQWDGYDAIAQTEDVCTYLRERQSEKPLFMVLSWGPPHAPYHTAPDRYQAMYHPEQIELRPNVLDDMADQARQMLAGYYAHCTALDDCFGRLLQTIEEMGLADDSIVVFSSDHGDMLCSQGQVKKQRPWEESIRVPFLLRYPHRFGRRGRTVDAMIDTPDVMPTLLGLCGLSTPSSVEGSDFTDHLQGGADPTGGAVVLNCPQPFGQFNRFDHGGVEYRGLRTERYTYVRTLAGPWLLYDNTADPYQLTNLVDSPEYQALCHSLDTELNHRLEQRGDTFESGEDYIRRWGYVVDEKGTVPYEN